MVKLLVVCDGAGIVMAVVLMLYLERVALWNRRLLDATFEWKLMVMMMMMMILTYGYQESEKLT